VDDGDRESADRTRARIEGGVERPSTFRDALERVVPAERDAWFDAVLNLGELPADGPELPRGCVPYLPCPVDAVLRAVDRADVGASDVFVDVGSGLGRAAILAHLLTEAPAIGVEIQSALASAARDLAARLRLPAVATVSGDAPERIGAVSAGTVFFLYCPFGGSRLARFLAALEPLAKTRMLRVCCVDLVLPDAPSWLELDERLAGAPGDLTIHRTTLHRPSARPTRALGGS
jgi:hypothetical protein